MAGYVNQRSSSADSPLRCAALRASPLPPPRTPQANPPFFLFRFPLPSVACLRGALLGGKRSLAACFARSSRSPLAPLSLAPLAGASGWRLVVLLRRVVTFLLVAPSAPLRSHSSLALRAGGRRCRPARGSSLLRGRSPSLPSRLSLLSASGAASLAAARLRSLPAPPFMGSWPRSRLFLRRCGGVVGCCCSLGGCSCVARLMLPRVVLFLRFRLRRAFPAVAPSPPSLRFPASPWLSRCAPLPLAARFPPLRSGRSLAARSSFGGRALSPAAVVCRRS